MLYVCVKTQLTFRLCPEAVQQTVCNMCVLEKYGRIQGGVKTHIK